VKAEREKRATAQWGKTKEERREREEWMAVGRAIETVKTEKQRWKEKRG
jgi:hypothetical protein